MPLGGPDFGGIVDPRDAHIRIWLDTLMAAKAHDDPLPEPAQPQYRTGCPACFLAMCEHDVDVGLNVERPSLCGHHLRELGKMVIQRRLTTAFLVNLNDWVTGRR
jgi:hypothetical protein